MIRFDINKQGCIAFKNKEISQLFPLWAEKCRIDQPLGRACDIIGDQPLQKSVPVGAGHP